MTILQTIQRAGKSLYFNYLWVSFVYPLVCFERPETLWSGLHTAQVTMRFGSGVFAGRTREAGSSARADSEAYTRSRERSERRKYKKH